MQGRSCPGPNVSRFGQFRSRCAARQVAGTVLLARANKIAHWMAKQNVRQTRNVASCYCLKTKASQITLLAS